jgi:hypothetical protein
MVYWLPKGNRVIMLNKIGSASAGAAEEPSERWRFFGRKAMIAATCAGAIVRRSHGMNRLLSLCFVFVLTSIMTPAQAGDFFQDGVFCYWCIRDAIYADTKLIAHLEANPDVDEAVKGPIIFAAHADIRRLRRLIGPIGDTGAIPCCYSRKPIYVR